MTSLLRTPLTAIEQMILRNVIDGTHLRGVTLENQAEHDAAVMSLIRRGLINYNRHRPRQKFIVTTAGRQQLEAKAHRPEAIGPIVAVSNPQDEWTFHLGQRRKFREIDGKLVEVDPNEPDPPPSGASLRVTAIDVTNGVITLGNGK